MFRIELFNSDLEQQWDKFIKENSINGTFLQSRRFLNYHPMGRFKDVSLVIYNEKNNIIALCPACELEEDGKRVFYSHKGSTFGGIIVDKKHYDAKYIISMVHELKAYLAQQGYGKMYLKMTSDIFSSMESDLFQYAFQYEGFTEYKEISTYVEFEKCDDDILNNLSQRKKRNVKNCIKEGLQVRELITSEEIRDFYDVLCENLNKYDTRPVHTLEELFEFKYSRLKKEVGFWGIYKEQELVAGAMMFYFDKVSSVHTQYLASKQEYNKLSPMTFLYYSMMIEMKKRGYKIISWGIATEDLGKVLNMGLITSKEEFGSSYVNNLTYMAQLD